MIDKLNCFENKNCKPHFDVEFLRLTSVVFLRLIVVDDEIEFLLRVVRIPTEIRFVFFLNFELVFLYRTFISF